MKIIAAVLAAASLNLGGAAYLKSTGITVLGYPYGKGCEKNSRLKLWNPKFPAT